MKPRFPSGSAVGSFPSPLSDIELARLWRRLATIPPIVLQRRRSRRPQIILAVAVATLAALAAFGGVVLFASDEGVHNPSAVVTEPSAQQQIELPDGSRLLPRRETKLRFASVTPNLVEVALLQGALGLAVVQAQPESRRFTIVAAGVTLSTNGGQFVVSVGNDGSEPRVEVTVQTGVVVVRRPEQGDRPAVMPLAAGDFWSSDTVDSR